MSTTADKAAPAKTTAEPAAQRAARPAAAPLADYRPETVAQRQLQDDIRNSPRAQQAVTYQRAIDRSGPRPVAVQKKENRTGLPDNLKTGVENLSGHSLDDVQVHYNSAKPAQLHAHAYAQGADIHLAPGQEKHLPHEAWHVAQQKQGRVKPTMQMKGGVPVNDNDGLEKEADAMGMKALGAVGPTSAELVQRVAVESTSVVQRVSVPKEKIKSALFTLGYGWKLGSDERTMSVWQIALDDDWDFHFTAMFDPTGLNMTKCHFTIRHRTGGTKGDDAFAWFDVEGQNKTATPGARENAGVTAYWTVDSTEYNTVTEEIRTEFANIDTWASDIITTAASYCKA